MPTYTPRTYDGYLYVSGKDNIQGARQALLEAASVLDKANWMMRGARQLRPMMEVLGFVTLLTDFARVDDFVIATSGTFHDEWDKKWLSVLAPYAVGRISSIRGDEVRTYTLDPEDGAVQIDLHTRKGAGPGTIGALSFNQAALALADFLKTHQSSKRPLTFDELVELARDSVQKQVDLEVD